jgi:predicted RND superfamily exporter protein
VLLANLASVLGFGGLITSSTPALRSLGRLAGLGMTACLAGTLLFLLPVLLRGEGLNPKSEIRNPNQCPKLQ